MRRTERNMWWYSILWLLAAEVCCHLTSEDQIGVIRREHQRLHSGRVGQWNHRTSREDSCVDGRLLPVSGQSSSKTPQRELESNRTQLPHAATEVSGTGAVRDCGQRLFVWGWPWVDSIRSPAQQVRLANQSRNFVRRRLLSLAPVGVVAGSDRELTCANPEQCGSVLCVLPTQEHSTRPTTDVQRSDYEAAWLGRVARRTPMDGRRDSVAQLLHQNS